MAKPNPAVFSITKRKFHNVLQGVAPPGVRLTHEDRHKYREWIRTNVFRYWAGRTGPIRTSDVIIMDDPQRTFRLHACALLTVAPPSSDR